jgi:DNA-binding NarL/FixJ family response regulator
MMIINQYLLRPSEEGIARLVAEDLSYKEIAHRLNRSPGTIKVTLSNLFQKLDIRTATHPRFVLGRLVQERLRSANEAG